MSKSPLEAAVCRKLKRFYEKKLTVSQAVAMYDRAKTRYRSMVLTGDGSRSSGDVLFDHVAYVNALARYATVRGVTLQEIR